MATLPAPLRYDGDLYEVPDDLQQELLDACTESAYRGSAMGSATKTWATFLTRHDLFGKSPFQINREYRGYTFITRPRLNLTARSIKQDRQMSMLNTLDPSGFPFALRCWLDSKFAQSTAAAGPALYCPYFNSESAFNIPLGNALIGLTGWPDPTLDVETSNGGYFSEDQTIVRGSDWGRRTYDFTLTFRDFQGGFVMGMLYYWLRQMGLLAQGATTPYTEYIDQWRLCYTCSIYRFVLDPTKRFIYKWAKATGCFPYSIPLGDTFNYGVGDEYIPTSREFSVQFKVNHISYMDPIILEQFVTLSSRYAGSDIIKAANGQALSADNQIVPFGAQYNFIGQPSINLSDGNLKFLWIANKDELTDPTQTVIQQIDNDVNTYLTQKIATANAAYSAAHAQSSPMNGTIGSSSLVFV